MSTVAAKWNISPSFFSAAVRQYWRTRETQRAGSRGGEGQGQSVRGGKQLDGVLEAIVELMLKNGVAPDDIFTDCRLHNTGKLDLPGYYRPTKMWDLLVVRDSRLIAAIELKGQAGPSFGNNFNNRTEEAMGSALDLWTAYREGALGPSLQPWLGYFFLLEDCPASVRPVSVREPHFKVFDEFRDASYAKRYELFCRKLVLERKYNAACLLMSNRERAECASNYTEPAIDLSAHQFLDSLLRQVIPTLTRK